MYCMREAAFWTDCIRGVARSCANERLTTNDARYSVFRKLRANSRKAISLRRYHIH